MGGLNDHDFGKVGRMKNFYHYIMSMLYLQIAHSKAANTAEWFKWIEKSMRHIEIIAKSIKEV